MGNRLYYAKKYEVKYDGGFFNWKIEEVENLFCELGIDVETQSEYPQSCPIHFETPIESFKCGLAKLRKMSTKKIQEIMGSDDITKKEVVGIFEDILKNCAKTSDWIHFEWF